MPEKLAAFVEVLKGETTVKAGTAPKQVVIGITGPSGSHKTKAAKHLVKAHGFKRIHAGEPIKKGLRKGLRLSKKQVAKSAKDQSATQLGGASFRTVSEPVGDAIHRTAPMATSIIMRKRVMKRIAKGHNVVVEGIRTPVEADTIKSMGGTLVRMHSGEGPDPRKPMDMRQNDIKADYRIDSSDKSKIPEACNDLMQKLGLCQ